MERLVESNRKNYVAIAKMKAILKNSTDIDAKLWEGLIRQSPQAAIYALPSYLDIIASGWQGIEVWRDQDLLAVMPILVKRKKGFSYALQPSFSQYWGIFFSADFPEGNYKAFSLKRKVIQAAIAAIPKEIKWFLSGFAPEFDYPLPFQWENFDIRNRYTYRIALDKSIVEIEKNFGNDTRYDIRKAEKEGIRVSENSIGTGLMRLIDENHDSGKILLQEAEKETLVRLIPFLIDNGLGHVFEANSNDGKLIAAALTASFAGKTMYLMSAQSIEGKSSGAMSLVLKTAIAKAAETDHIFDFEGSMIEGIEGFFRGFGGSPIPYSIIEKNQLPLLVRWIRKLR